MRQKGIAPLLLVAAIAALTVIIGIAVVLTREGGEVGGGAPVYSGSLEVPMPPYFSARLWYASMEGISITTYFVSGKTASEVLSWYRREMIGRGYENYAEISLASLPIPPYGSFEWGWVAFRKGNMAVVVGAFSGTTDGETGCWYAIGEGPLDKLVPPGAPGGPEQLPSSDQVSGFEPITRYPGSVMLWHETTGPWPDRIEVRYGSSENRHRVIGFWFKTQLTSAGWGVIDEEESEDSVTLWLRKGENEVGIYVYPPNEDRAYSRIEVVFDSWRIPANDLDTGEEPIQRYPGAVIVEHVQFIMAGMKTITISYVTRAGADEVYSWYLNSLPGQGWQISSQSEGSLSATKENSILIVKVSRNERQYTEIEIQYTGPA